MTRYFETSEPTEGEPVQFLGIYALRWPWESGRKPTHAFNEVDDPLLDAAPDLLAACEALLHANKSRMMSNWYPFEKQVVDARNQARAAIAKAKDKLNGDKNGT